MNKIQYDKLKVGDRIKFRRDLIVENCYGFILLDKMATHLGKYVTVTGLSTISAVFIKENGYIFHYEMFEDTFKFGK